MGNVAAKKRRDAEEQRAAREEAARAAEAAAIQAAIDATPEDQRISIGCCSAFAILFLASGASFVANGAAWSTPGDNTPADFTIVGAFLIVLAFVCLGIMGTQIRDHGRRSRDPPDEPADDNAWPEWGKNPSVPKRPDPDRPVQSL